MTMAIISKPFYLISLIVMVVPITSFAQTDWYSPVATTDELNTVFFLDSLHGWVGGSVTTAGAGVIKKTTNGGATWVSQSLPVTDLIYRIVFLTSNVGFAVGINGALLKTTDGGTTWLQIRSGTRLQSIFFFDSQHGWACGGDSVLSTTDQGATWSASLAAGAIDLWDISFRTLQEGWTVGLYGGCYKTKDGGNSWSPITPPITGVSLFGVSFPTSSRGIIIAASGIALSTDAGITWTTVRNSGGSQLMSVSFADSLVGWAVGQNKILKTTDGGYSWAEQVWPAPNNFLVAINSPDKNHAWVVGSKIILKTTDGGGTNLGPDLWIPPYNGHYVHFGHVAVGTIKKDTLGIINLGSANLIISSITSSNAQFVASPNSANLAPGAALGIVVTFAPLDTAAVSGYLIITHNAATSPDTILLDGNTQSATRAPSENGSAPISFSLGQNYPNPFNPTTAIEYAVPKRLHVIIAVYDMLGRQVKELVNAERTPGRYQVTLDASNFSSGVYLYRLTAGSFVDTKKLLVIK